MKVVKKVLISICAVTLLFTCGLSLNLFANEATDIEEVNEVLTQEKFDQIITETYGVAQVEFRKKTDTQFELPKDTPFVWRITRVEKPLFIDSNKGLINWSYVNDNQEFKVTISATDEVKNTFSKAISVKLIVKEKNFLTIKEVGSKSDYTTVENVRGVLTAISSGMEATPEDSMYIKKVAGTFQDETGGIYLFGIDKFQAMFLTIGETYDITGIKGSYNSVNQIQDISHFENVSENERIVINPINITKKDDASEVTDNYKLGTAVGHFDVIPTEIQEKTSYKFVLASGEEIDLRTLGTENSGTSVFHNLTELVNSLSPKQKIEITAPITFFNGNPQFQLYNTSQIKVLDASSYDSGELLELAINAPQFPVSIHENMKLDFPIKFLDKVELNYESSNPKVINHEGEVNLDNLIGKEEITITITASLEGQEIKRTQVIILGDHLKINEIRELADEVELEAKGIVTQIHYNDKFNNASMYLQDDSAAISLYRVPTSLLGNIRVGSEIEVKGTKTTFNGHVQLKDITSLNRLQKKVDLPEKVIVNGINDMKENPGMLAEIEFELLKDLNKLSSTNDKNQLRGEIIEVLLNDGSKTKFKLPNPEEVEQFDYSMFKAKLEGLKKGTKLVVDTNIAWFYEPQFELFQTDQILSITAKKVTETEINEVKTNINNVKEKLNTFEIINKKEEAIKEDVKYILKADYDLFVSKLEELEKELTTEISIEKLEEINSSIIKEKDIEDKVLIKKEEEKPTTPEKPEEPNKEDNKEVKKNKGLVITLVIISTLLILSGLTIVAFKIFKK